MSCDLERERDEAERKAFEALARYKFQMFGYWAAIWVHLNRLCEPARANPFRALVKAAREREQPKKEATEKLFAFLESVDVLKKVVRGKE